MFAFAMLALTASALVPNSAHSTGVPESVCDSMMPTPCHRYQEQDSFFPYEVVPSKTTVKPNEKVHIEIRGTTLGYKGFMVEIRDENEKAVGKFFVPEGDSDVATINCHGGVATAVSHKNGLLKYITSLQWIAPNIKKKYTIYVTLAKNYEVYWVRQKMGQIKVE